MIRPLVRRLRLAGLRGQVRKAVDAGVGVYNRTWPIDRATTVPPQEDQEFPRARARALATQVLDWCRLTMGQMRKPYGLDYVSLVIAVTGAEDGEMAQENLGILRPHEFYSDDGIARRVEELLVRWVEDDVFSPKGDSDPPRLAAVLFSWGDLTRELLLAG